MSTDSLNVQQPQVLTADLIKMVSIILRTEYLVILRTAVTG